MVYNCRLAWISGTILVVPRQVVIGPVSAFLSLFFVSSVPGAAGGIDMDSDLIIEIAKEGANICGVKLT